MTKATIPISLSADAVSAPIYATEGAAGADLVAAISAEEPITLAPGARAIIPTGVSIELPDYIEAQIRPRSGLAAKHGVTTLNAPGTIDWDYRGEIAVILINHGEAPFVVTRGMRIAQLVLAPVIRGQWSNVSELDATARGSGGFGSTGLEGAPPEKEQP